MNRFVGMSVALVLVAAAAACAPYPLLQAGVSSRATPASASLASAETAATRVQIISPAASAGMAATAPPPPPPTDDEIAALVADRDVEVVLPPQPVPQFIDTVFGRLLQTPYYSGPGVSERRDLVTLRTNPRMNARALFRTVRAALAQYGLEVSIEGGAVQISEGRAAAGAFPFVRTTAGGPAPEGAQPVVQYVELRAIDAGSLMALLDEVYPGRDSLTIVVQADANALLVSGAGRDVAAASAVISALDQPRFQNGRIARVEPAFWPVDRFAEALIQVLATEGYKVGQIGDETPRPLVILPVPFGGQLLIFAQDAVLLERALHWARELDRASSTGGREGVFVYAVRNTSAADLAALVSRAAPAAGGEDARTRTTVARPRDASDGPAPVAPVEERITVDSGGNRLIFRGSASEYERLRSLMEQLDTPPRQVLVELTIAEVTLTDETRFGFEWFLRDVVNSANIATDTRGGLSREAGGLGVAYSRAFSRGIVEAALNTIAENKNLNILSTPRLMARSGGDAEILIGTEVPIITSQRAANNQSGGNTDILQTVQYRQTGIILKMKPVVYGDDRIDIEIFQEVSSQEPNRTSAISSPIILNRSVTTQLSLREGTTAVIGGLIQDNYSREQRGVPLLKDIPIAGTAFRSDSVSGGKVELFILVTPYIVRNDEETAGLANSATGRVNQLLRVRGPRVHTLLPWRAPLQSPRLHGRETGHGG